MFSRKWPNVGGGGRCVVVLNIVGENNILDGEGHCPS